MPQQLWDIASSLPNVADCDAPEARLRGIALKLAKRQGQRWDGRKFVPYGVAPSPEAQQAEYERMHSLAHAWAQECYFKGLGRPARVDETRGAFQKALRALIALGVPGTPAPNTPKPMQGLADWLRSVAERQAGTAEDEKCIRQWAREVDAASGVPASPAPSIEAEFELHAEDGVCLAGASGPRAEAWAEIQLYAAQYKQDGPVVIYEVTRTPVPYGVDGDTTNQPKGGA